MGDPALPADAAEGEILAVCVTTGTVSEVGAIRTPFYRATLALAVIGREVASSCITRRAVFHILTLETAFDLAGLAGSRRRVEEIIVLLVAG